MLVICKMQVGLRRVGDQINEYYGLRHEYEQRHFTVTIGSNINYRF